MERATEFTTKRKQYFYFAIPNDFLPASCTSRRFLLGEYHMVRVPHMAFIEGTR